MFGCSSPSFFSFIVSALSRRPWDWWTLAGPSMLLNVFGCSLPSFSSLTAQAGVDAQGNKSGWNTQAQRLWEIDRHILILGMLKTFFNFVETRSFLDAG
jgi:hypothetical protein